jgi:hypothetical protein
MTPRGSLACVASCRSVRSARRTGDGKGVVTEEGVEAEKDGEGEEEEEEDVL